MLRHKVGGHVMNQSIIIMVVVLLVTLAALIVVAALARRASTQCTDKAMKELIKIIATLATAMAVVIGGGTAAAALTSCKAQRTITVSGEYYGADTSRVVIKSTEAYQGVRKY